MGKKHKHARAQKKKEWEPAYDNPFCPTCRMRDQLIDVAEDSGMTECGRCDIRFFIEEVEEGESEAADGWTTPRCQICLDRAGGCHVCEPGKGSGKGKRKGSAKKSAEVLEVQLVPTVGKMVELTDV